MRLYNEDIHFLDTNILLSMVLPDDESYEKSKDYLNTDYCRYVSNTAYLEAKNKIRKLRRISLKITEYCKKYALNNQINPINMSKHLFRIKKEFLKQYGNNSFPEGLKKERFDNFVNSFFSGYEFEITDILINKNNDSLDGTIISSFRESINKLNNFIKKYLCITFLNNSNKFKSLRKIKLDKTDAKLVDESYLLHILLNEVIFFITFDKGILRLSDKIKGIITPNIHIRSPMNLV